MSDQPQSPTEDLSARLVRAGRRLGRAPVILLGGLLLMVAFKAVDWTVELLWMHNLGFESVFWKLKLYKVALFAAAFVPGFLYVWLNLRGLARNVDVSSLAPGLPQLPPGRLNALSILTALAVGIVFGFAFYSAWDSLVRLLWAQDFGASDPIYGNDLGFYVFVLPLLRTVQGGVLVLVALVTLVSLLLYLRSGALRLSRRGDLDAPAPVIRHLAVNVVLLLVLWGLGYLLDRYALLTDPSGAVYGAGYTAVNVVRPALWAAAGATLALIGIILWGLIRGRLRAISFSIAGYVAILFIALVVIPGLYQRFVVEPNELELERPYLRHNIASTRAAYGLDRVVDSRYRPAGSLDLAEIEANDRTIRNIRLWDWRPLLRTFGQLQQIRSYYEFNDVDIDRYPIEGDIHQVLLSARELSNEQLPGQRDSWVNRRLQYTHGYGVTMALASQKDSDGTPILVIQDIPPRSRSEDLAVDRSALYYGEEQSGYRIVSTGIEEFDYPKGDENVYASYDGHGGIPLDSGWKRLLLAIHQQNVSLLLSDYINRDSRMQLWRPIQQRILRIAPFLELDRDPYMVVHDGRLFWIQDAYTLSSELPYAEQHDDGFNYIRNAVKVVVDAYHGDVRFYVFDEQDPLLGAYKAAFPALFRSRRDMPEGLLRHVRYPQDLFEAQIDKYSVYHMTEPQVFYNREDVWTVPREKYGGQSIPVQPYYILMELPGEDRLQFLLMLPLTPVNRDNMIAWIAARSDVPDYGEIIAFKLPKEELILGPSQIEAKIDQDTLISRQLSLWDQRGSRVIRGNLLVIPIEKSFIYVEPVYLQAEDGDIPQLKRIIVSDGDQVAMEPSLSGALRVVFGEREPTVADTQAATAASVQDTLKTRAREALSAAEQALEQGQWERFGREMRRLKSLLGDGGED